MSALTTDRERELGRRLLEEALGNLSGERPAARFEVGYGTFCAHRQLVIVREQRRVTCKRCGAVLDPFDVVWMLSADERELQAARAHLAALKAGIESAAADERRAKARAARAKKLAEAAEARARAGAQEGLDL